MPLVVTKDENPNSAEFLLWAKTKDPQCIIRRNAAIGSDVPVAILTYLAKDKSAVVRQAVALNPNTPMDILDALAEEPVWEIRRNLLANPSTPETILRKFAVNDNSYRLLWLNRKDTPIDILWELYEGARFGVRRDIAKHPNTDENLLITLSEDEDLWVRVHVAGHPNTPLKILKEFAIDTNNLLRTSVAESPTVPSNILVMLFEYEKSFAEPCVSVIYALYKNSKLPAFAKKVIETLYNDITYIGRRL